MDRWNRRHCMCADGLLRMKWNSLPACLLARVDRAPHRLSVYSLTALLLTAFPCSCRNLRQRAATVCSSSIVRLLLVSDLIRQPSPQAPGPPPQEHCKYRR
ncbi:hypothetical protein SCHPADRAFT_472849 [Schizopora paradoxa]|uniref:Uncharacterized protein n=1 Tax=Schizopora paradoxa TaxID=27342 RepID=A0A0H2RI05_9AGAM|nr:hypothetical protein SCHPADRAFT_472849 [Schizopora paradoxa]